MNCSCWAGWKTGNDLLGGAVLVLMTVLAIVEGEAVTVTVGTALVLVTSCVVVWRDQRFSLGCSKDRPRCVLAGSRKTLKVYASNVEFSRLGKRVTEILNTYGSLGRRKVCRDHRWSCCDSRAYRDS